MFAVVGVVAAVLTAGGFARAGRPDFTPSKAPPGWGVFTPAQWKTVSLGIERRGFDAASIRLVNVTDTADHRPFGLVAGRSNAGTTCVTPVTGTTLGATVCKLSKPLVVFTAPQTWKEGSPARIVHATAVLGIARQDVSGVVVSELGRQGGTFLIQTGRLKTFAAGFRNMSSLRAFNLKNETLARLVFRAP
jgi:hypothetical protein